jgi:ferredoxin
MDYSYSLWTIIITSAAPGPVDAGRLALFEMTKTRPNEILLCSCDDTMPLDADAVRRACRGADVTTAKQLCRAELARFRTAAARGEPLIVGCTQEAPVFREASAEAGHAGEVTFVNLRETAGWSDQAAGAGPKMAALAAAAAEPDPEIPFVTLTSGGTLLIYGRDEPALEAARLLKDHLDVTVLLSAAAGAPPPSVTEFPLAKGTIRSITGRLGAFEIVVDDYALPSPSSRDALVFGRAQDGAKSRCDIVLDTSGRPPLFAVPELRDGYLRADPGDPVALLRAVLKARDLVGAFDKPRYVDFTEDLCAHSRSRIVGCHRCLDLCPTGAITPNGDHVAIDAAICGGCGECAAACPTGAAAYALPPADLLMRRLRALLSVFREAGGKHPILLIHDEEHGTALIEALARYGTGLPAKVLPLAVNEVGQIGLETIVAAFAYGAAAVRLIVRQKPRHDLAGLRQTLALAAPILSTLGFGSLATIETDDPDVLGAALREIAEETKLSQPASFVPIGGKREVLWLALRELQRVAPQHSDTIVLPEGAPFGAVEINVDGCTLCLSCISACPTSALGDDPDEPLLRFKEELCVQCGLCKATCPEKVITLVPRLDFRVANAPARVLKREEPFSCVRCGKPFGVKSAIERVAQKLEGRHWMYQSGSKRLDLIKMCDDCRVAAVTEEGFDPHAGPQRPRTRTSEDYLREREERRREEKGEE